MNCPYCGAPAPDGTAFCVTCGKPLAAAQQQMGGQPMGGQQFGGQPMGGQMMGGQQYGGQPMGGQMMGGQPMGMYQQMPPSQAGMIFSDIFRLFGESITKPATSALSVVEKNRGLQGLFIAVLQVILVFFTFLIHLPVGEFSQFFQIEDRAKIGAVMFFVVALSYMLYVVAGFLFRDKSNFGLNFVNIMGMYGTAMTYSTLLIVLIFIFGLFSMGIAAILAFLSIFSWICSAYNVTKQVVGGSEDAKTVTANITCIAVSFIVVLAIYIFIRTDVIDLFFL